MSHSYDHTCDCQSCMAEFDQITRGEDEVPSAPPETVGGEPGAEGRGPAHWIEVGILREAVEDFVEYFSLSGPDLSEYAAEFLANRESLTPPIPESEPGAIRQWRSMGTRPENRWRDFTNLDGDWSDIVESELHNTRIVYTHPPVEPEGAQEFYTGHSVGCNGKCGQNELSPDVMDYCKAQKAATSILKYKMRAILEPEGAREWKHRPQDRYHPLVTALQNIAGQARARKKEAKRVGDNRHFLVFGQIEGIADAALAHPEASPPAVTPGLQDKVGRFIKAIGKHRSIESFTKETWASEFWEMCEAFNGAPLTNVPEMFPASPAVTERGE